MDSVKSMIPRILYKPEYGFAQQASEFYFFMVVCFLVPLVLLKLRLRRRYKLPPSPPGYPILGHLHLLGTLPHHSMTDLAKKYGDIYWLRLGSVPAIAVSSPRMAQEFLQKHDTAWASRPLRNIAGGYLSYDCKVIGFASTTPEWRNLRKICTKELVTNRRMQASSGVREEEMRQMISDGQQGQSVDFKLKLNVLAANVMARLVLNRPFSMYVHPTAQEEPEMHEFQEITEEFVFQLGGFMEADFLPWLRPLDIGGKEKLAKAARVRQDAFLDNIINEHKEMRRKGAIDEKDKDMVDVLLNPEDHTQQIDMNDVKATMLNLLLGGTNTTAVTIEWRMSELLRHPQCMAKLQAELDAVHAGFEIPRGTRLFVNIYAFMRDERVWERAEVFDPERFMAGRDAEVDIKGNDFRLLPFGSGRRVCLGIPLGMIMVERTLATMVHAFDWSLPGGRDPRDLDMAESWGITLCRIHNIVTIDTPRIDTPRLHARLY